MSGIGRVKFLNKNAFIWMKIPGRENTSKHYPHQECPIRYCCLLDFLWLMTCLKKCRSPESSSLSCTPCLYLNAISITDGLVLFLESHRLDITKRRQKICMRQALSMYTNRLEMTTSKPSYQFKKGFNNLNLSWNFQQIYFGPYM